jgi:5-formyltetrahydrofolate cyclo-ligase
VLRRLVRAARKSMKLASPDAAEQAAQLFFEAGEALPPIVALYNPTGAEFDPTPLARRLAARGVVLALPEVTAASAPLRFVRAADATVEVDPELIFTPLIAFDGLGGRLGQGGGYYDRTMAARRAGPEPPRFIGLGYASQEVALIPHGLHDQRLDGVLTEKAYLSFPCVSPSSGT